ncbi:MAG: hypothetical protein ABI193_12435 [Minicystis sp.]
MIPNKALLVTFSALSALTGCISAVPPETSGEGVVAETPGTETPAPAKVDPAAALAHVDQNLARLAALQVFTVGTLIVDLPEEATNCYGPCPGSEGVIQKAKEQAAVRLEKLTAVAEAAADKPAQASCDKAAIDTNLAALADLRIVGVEGLIEVQPKNNPQCYNLPCQADIAAAKAATCEHATDLGAIVQAAKGL